MLLHLIRHPKLEVAPGLCYGQSDIAANHMHCLQVAAELRMQLPAYRRLISSPLQRCQELASMLDPLPEVDARLMEMHFGTWEMRAWDTIARVEIDAWANDVTAYAPGGGESILFMAIRVLDFLITLGTRSELASTEVVLVSHAGPLSMILAYQLGMSAQDLATAVVNKRKRLDFGECIQVQIKLC